MKAGTLVAVLCAVTVSAGGITVASEGDPCATANSNAEQSQCYTVQQKRVNAEVAAYADRVVRGLRRDATKAQMGKGNSRLLVRAADSLAKSQENWKVYRDSYCAAVEYSFTSGSGGGLVSEACMFFIGRERLEMLKDDFPNR